MPGGTTRPDVYHSGEVHPGRTIVRKPDHASTWREPLRDRIAGVLVHPTSLSGPGGLGDLGPSTERFLDRIRDAGLRAWQVLPLVPTGPGNSPYSGLSAFAGNPLLISPQRLERSGWLPRGSVANSPRFPATRIDFERVAPWRSELLVRSWKQFRRHASQAARRRLAAFVEHTDRQAWLSDWALYSALKLRHDGRPWYAWDHPLRTRLPTALKAAEAELADDVAFCRYVQFLFHEQWNAIRRACRRRDIAVVGDLPYYVAHDSHDVWAHQQLFRLDDSGRALEVGGVPPDYFSESGQRWGDPLFDWDRMAATGYRWWIDRLRTNLDRVDLLRLDHFRGFAAYWRIDATQETAAQGCWLPGPGRALFDAARASLGDLPLIAEDLGVITEDVDALKDELGLPGMQVLQFGHDDPQSRHRTEHHREHSVAYTGTHDNDTSRGWFESLPGDQRARILDELQATDRTVVSKMVEAVFRSRAALVVVPLQDLLDLGSAARLNRPGQAGGNWSWRVSPRAFTPALARRLRRLARTTSRI